MQCQLHCVFQGRECLNNLGITVFCEVQAAKHWSGQKLQSFYTLKSHEALQCSIYSKNFKFLAHISRRGATTQPHCHWQRFFRRGSTRHASSTTLIRRSDFCSSLAQCQHPHRVEASTPGNSWEFDTSCMKELLVFGARTGCLFASAVRWYCGRWKVCSWL